ncbi:Nsp1-like C-terminal region-domain-containing protein, partial [Paraphysoderma sedebokerense]
LEEILNKWTTELDSHVLQFHSLANSIQQTDLSLIQNGNLLSKLYNDYVNLSNLQSSIDQNLEFISSQQAELNEILDGYERNVEELISSSAASGSGYAGLVNGSNTSVDEEREKMYRLAENLNSELDELSRNLGEMVTEVNNVRAAKKPGSDKENGGDVDGWEGEDALSAITKILNAHLTSLQWIDSTSTSLTQKIKEVAKLSGEVEREVGRVGITGVGWRR